MNSNFQNQKPNLVMAIAIMTLTSGIINLFWGFVASVTVLGTIVGVVCLPLTILPTILGVFEIIHAAKLLSAQPQPVQPSPAIAMCEIATVLMGNVFSMIVGIVALIFYNDLTVKEYFSYVNSPSLTTSPALPPQAETQAEAVEPAAAEKPKRSRKTAPK